MRHVTDDRLLQELLKSPLDDMPEGPSQRLLMGIGTLIGVLVLGLVAMWLFGGDESGGDGASAAATTVATGDSAAPGDPSVTATSAVAAAVYPEANGRFHEMVALGDGEMLMFGGFIGFADGTVPFEGTWRFDTLAGEWSVEYPGIAPSPRIGFAMAYHPPTGKVVVFGGGETTPRPCPRINFCPGPEDNQVWQYDPRTGVWEDMTPPENEGDNWPIPRFGMRFIYEPVTERLIMFGGVGVFGDALTPNFWNDTWAYDPATNTWEDLSDPDDANRPHGSVQYGFVWNEEAQRVLMFGGDGIPDDPQTLYAFDPVTNTWEDLGENEPDEGPKDRVLHSFVADPQSGRAVMFGGNGSIYRIITGGTIRTNGNLDDVWTWSPAEGWIDRAPLAGDILAAAAAADPTLFGIIVYGGDDVWSYDVPVDAWTLVWERPGEDAG